MVEIEASRECQLLSGFMSLKSCDWCYIKSTIKKVINKILRKKLNTLNIFQFAYYWPACGNSICLTVVETFPPVEGLVPKIAISSSSKEDSCHAN